MTTPFTTDHSAALEHYTGLLHEISPRQAEIARHIVLIKRARKATCDLRTTTLGYSSSVSDSFLPALHAIESALAALLLERELWS